jgi:hypothetical protein
MTLQESLVPPQQDANVALAGAGVCPICGVDVLQEDVGAAEEDYFCPYCTTRTMPHHRP